MQTGWEPGAEWTGMVYDLCNRAAVVRLRLFPHEDERVPPALLSHIVGLEVVDSLCESTGRTFMTWDRGKHRKAMSLQGSETGRLGTAPPGLGPRSGLPPPTRTSGDNKIYAPSGGSCRGGNGSLGGRGRTGLLGVRYVAYVAYDGRVVGVRAAGDVFGGGVGLVAFFRGLCVGIRCLFINFAFSNALPGSCLFARVRRL